MSLAVYGVDGRDEHLCEVCWALRRALKPPSPPAADKPTSSTSSTEQSSALAHSQIKGSMVSDACSSSSVGRLTEDHDDEIVSNIVGESSCILSEGAVLTSTDNNELPGDDVRVVNSQHSHGLGSMEAAESLQNDSATSQDEDDAVRRKMRIFNCVLTLEVLDTTMIHHPLFETSPSCGTRRGDGRPSDATLMLDSILKRRVPDPDPKTSHSDSEPDSEPDSDPDSGIGLFEGAAFNFTDNIKDTLLRQLARRMGVDSDAMKATLAAPIAKGLIIAVAVHVPAWDLWEVTFVIPSVTIL